MFKVGDKIRLNENGVNHINFYLSRHDQISTNTLFTIEYVDYNGLIFLNVGSWIDESHIKEIKTNPPTSEIDYYRWLAEREQ